MGATATHGCPRREAWVLLSLVFTLAGSMLAACRGGHPSQPIRPFERDPVLDRLLEEERHEEAMAHAIAELRSLAERNGPMDPETLLRLARVAIASTDGGDLATAEMASDAAIRGFRSVLPPGDPRLAEILVNGGRIVRIVQERDNAWRLYQEAGRLLEDAGPVWELVRADLERAEASWLRRSDPDRSIELFETALRRLENEPASRFVSFQRANAEGWFGWMLSSLGRSSEASPHLQRAQDALHRLGLDRHHLNGVIDNARGETLALEGRWDEAEPFFHEAAEIFAGTREKFAPGFARRIHPLDGFGSLAVIALRHGRFEEAWRLTQRSQAATHMDFALLGLWRDRDPEGFRRAQALRSEILELHHARALDASRGLSAWEPQTWERTLRFMELEQQLRCLETRYVRASGFPEPSLARIQALLGPRTAFLGTVEVMLGSEATPWRPRLREGWLYIVRPAGPVVWVPLGIEDQDRRAEAWPRLVYAASWPFHVEADPETVTDGRMYGRRYLDPAIPYLHGIEHVVFEGSYIGPIEAMIGPDGRYVGDSFDVSYVPSAYIADLVGQRRSDRPHDVPRSVLAVSAAPGEGPTESLEALAMLPGEQRDLRSFRKSFSRKDTSLGELPTLRLAGLEVSSVASKFPRATVLQGPEGVERRLRELSSGGRLAGYDVLHFAGHSLVDPIPERSGLALAARDPAQGLEDDGILDVEEILLGWSLDATLLTLSGCETAVAGGVSRGETLGFTPALLAVGARNVLSSVWPVDDGATAILMDRFYDDLLGGHGPPMPPARALREAKAYLRSFVDDTGRRPFEHPAYWAGFILTGLPEGAAAARRP